jgi:hypothetical protein
MVLIRPINCLSGDMGLWSRDLGTKLYLEVRGCFSSSNSFSERLMILRKGRELVFFWFHNPRLFTILVRLYGIPILSWNHPRSSSSAYSSAFSLGTAFPKLSNFLGVFCFQCRVIEIDCVPLTEDTLLSYAVVITFITTIRSSVFPYTRFCWPGAVPILVYADSPLRLISGVPVKI